MAVPRYIERLAILAMAALAAGCASWDTPQMLARTYSEARVAIPPVVRQGTMVAPGYSGVMSSEAAQAQLRAIAAAGVRMPVVLYLHGCSGLGFAELGDLARISTLGVIAVAPNSYARPGRPVACNDLTKTHVGPGMWQIRSDELAFARDRLAAEPWVDNARVVAFGFSEGGFVVAGTSDARFVGYAVTGSNCNGYGQVGIRAPAGKPALAIRSTSDPWLTSADACDRAVAGRPHSQSLALDKPGHFMNNEPEARAAIDRFLRTTLELR